MRRKVEDSLTPEDGDKGQVTMQPEKRWGRSLATISNLTIITNTNTN